MAHVGGVERDVAVTATPAKPGPSHHVILTAFILPTLQHICCTSSVLKTVSRMKIEFYKILLVIRH